MSATIQSIANFKRIVTEHSSKDKDKANTILANIQKVQNTNPKVYNKKGVQTFLEQRAKVLEDLLDQWLTAAVSKVFPLIDNDMFNLQRHLLLQKSGKSYTLVKDETEEKDAKPDKKKYKSETKTISIPLFAYTPLLGESKHKVKLGSFRWTDDWDNYTCTINATLPGEIGSNLQKTYREAVARTYKLFSEFYVNPTVAEMLPLNLAFEIGAIWIPTHDSLSIKTTIKPIKKKDIDPAMVLKFNQKLFLIKLWQVDDEEPIEHFLREFTTDNLSNTLQ